MIMIKTKKCPIVRLYTCRSKTVSNVIACYYWELCANFLKIIRIFTSQKVLKKLTSICKYMYIEINIGTLSLYDTNIQLIYRNLLI
jgi:hypothetical protein